MQDHQPNRSVDSGLVVAQKITELQTTAANKEKQVDGILADSEKVQHQIQETYKLATNLGLAGALFARKRELSRLVAWWLVAFIVFGLATIIVILSLLPHLTGQPVETFLSRGLFVTPAVALTVFSYNQYRSERRLLEQYSFRAALAQQLESYTDLLSRQFADEQFKDRILTFVLKSMDNIYDGSSIEIPRSFMQFSLRSKAASLETTIKEEASSIKQDISGVQDKVDALSAPAAELLTVVRADRRQSPTEDE
jgi:hypothetical protein